MMIRLQHEPFCQRNSGRTCPFSLVPPLRSFRSSADVPMGESPAIARARPGNRPVAREAVVAAEAAALGGAPPE